MLLRHSFLLGCCVALGLAGSAFVAPSLAADGAKFRVYFGTYTRQGKSEGIYRSEFDATTGQLSKPELAGTAVNPSFLVVHPSLQFLYAVSEGGGPRKKGESPPSGSVAAFAVDAATGNIKALNSQESGGAGPCHVSIDKAGRNVLVANYGGGSCGVLPVNDDGSLAPMSSVQKHTGQGGSPEKPIPPRAHSINLDGTNRYGAENLYQNFRVKQRLWRFGLSPEQVAPFLAEFGWREVEQMGPREFGERYIAPLGRALKVSGLERSVYAERG